MSEAKIIVQALPQAEHQPLTCADVEIFVEVHDQRAKVNNCNYLKFEVDPRKRRPPELIMHVYPNEVTLQGQAQSYENVPLPDPQDAAHKQINRQVYKLNADMKDQFRDLSRQVEQLRKEPRPSEALYLFAAWITSMDDPPIGNPTENPGDWAKLVETFCEHNNLAPPDCKYPGLTHPPRQQ